jgi:hypothetical protein
MQQNTTNSGECMLSPDYSFPTPRPGVNTDGAGYPSMQKHRSGTGERAKVPLVSQVEPLLVTQSASEQ